MQQYAALHALAWCGLSSLQENHVWLEPRFCYVLEGLLQCMCLPKLCCSCRLFASTCRLVLSHSTIGHWQSADLQRSSVHPSSSSGSSSSAVDRLPPQRPTFPRHAAHKSNCDHSFPQGTPITGASGPALPPRPGHSRSGTCKASLSQAPAAPTYPSDTVLAAAELPCVLQQACLLQQAKKFVSEVRPPQCSSLCDIQNHSKNLPAYRVPCLHCYLCS